MKLSVPTETAPREQRVALAPESVVRLIKQLKVEILVQRGAGLAAGFRDEAFEAGAARIVPGAAAALSGGEVVAKVQPPNGTEIEMIPAGTTVLSLMNPGRSCDLAEALETRVLTRLT